jgi:hypothetical protein
MPTPKEVSTSILTLLNNIEELIVVSNDRQSADQVMKVIKIYADNNGYKLPDGKIDGFRAILLDSKPNTLASVIQDIAMDILASERYREQHRRKQNFDVIRK